MIQRQMLRQVMSPGDIYANADALVDMLRDHYGSYDADSLDEVLVDESFVQRLKARGFDIIDEAARSDGGVASPPVPRRAPARPPAGTTPLRRAPSADESASSLRRREVTSEGESPLPLRRSRAVTSGGESGTPMRRSQEATSGGESSTPLRRSQEVTSESEGTSPAPRSQESTSEGTSPVPRSRESTSGGESPTPLRRSRAAASERESPPPVRRRRVAANEASPSDETPAPTPAPRTRRTTRAKPSSDGQTEA